MNKIMLAFLLLVLASTAASSQNTISQPDDVKLKPDAATNLHFVNNIMAQRSDDKRLYVLLGSGFLRPFSFGEPKTFVSKWLNDHPSSVAIPVSRMISTNTRTYQQMEIVYVWVEDGAASLNVELVRNGIFLAATMCDMVDNRRGLEDLLKHDPKLAETRAQVEKERAAAPEDRTDRLVSERDYKVRLSHFVEAERYARTQKLGIWSDAMKKEREVEHIR